MLDFYVLLTYVIPVIVTDLSKNLSVDVYSRAAEMSIEDIIYIMKENCRQSKTTTIMS